MDWGNSVTQPPHESELPTFSPGNAGADSSAEAARDSEARPDFPGLEVIEEIAPGTGGMGRVYRARDTSLDRVVAVKTTRLDMLTPEGREFFKREARAAARLDHPNIVRVFGFHPDHSPPYYVMQYVQGDSLEQACKGRSIEFVAEVMEKAARALAYAHSKGVIHRDIKPSNILVDYQGEPHLTDFGLAHAWQEAAQARDQAVSPTAGTPFFVAPEMHLDSGHIGPSVDIYAFGVTLYRLLTGRYPFVGRDREELRRRVLGEDAPLPQEVKPAIPEPLQRICLKAIERNPGARYHSAAALADELERFREGEEVFARPSRYEVELRGRLQNHLTAIQQWREEHLIEVPEMDRLVRPYRRLLEAESPWHMLYRRFPWETVILRVGGLLVLVGTVLWVLYWEDLSRLERVLAAGLPTLAMNLSGWLYHRRRNRANTLIFLTTGALLLPVFLGTVLTQYELLRFPQQRKWELFEEEATGAGEAIEADSAGGEAMPEERRQAGGGERVHRPTNAQVTLCGTVFAAYCVFLLVVMKAKAFAVWSGLAAYLLFTSTLLLLGLKEWVRTEHIARATVCYLAFCPAFRALPAILERRRLARWAPALYLFFPVPFAAVMTLLARRGSIEWLHASEDLNNETFQLWLMANGMAYFVFARRASRSRLGYVRFWGFFFMLLVPISLLLPLNLLADKGHEIFGVITKEGAEASFTAYRAASGVVALGLLVLGTRLGQQVLAISGSAGLAVFLTRAAIEIFDAYVSWPLALVVLGGLALVIAWILALRRLRREQRALE